MDEENLIDLSADIPLLEREDQILRFLWEEGYCPTSCIRSEVMPQISLQNVRRILKNLLEHQIVGYKELPTTHREGPGERVYHLKIDGLQILEKSSSEIARYTAGIQRIRSPSLRHFLAVRKFERHFLRAIQQSEYHVASLNEFYDAGKLYFQLQPSDGTRNLRSDALITIKRQGYERLTIRLELDRGTEGFGQIFQKLDTYVLYNTQSALVAEHSQTFPVLVLFIMKAERAKNLAQKLHEHPSNKFLWFLAAEHVETSDLWLDPVVFDHQEKLSSLQALVVAREPILAFQNAVSQAGVLETAYHYTIATRFSTAHDAFFPVKIEYDNKDLLWMPDGYMRIYRQMSQEKKELLFAIILVVNDESGDQIIEKLLPCESFFAQDSQRKRIIETNHYGCLAIVKNADKIQEVRNVLQNLKISPRSRIILLEDCIPEKIFHEPVWITASGDSICLLPGGKK